MRKIIMTILLLGCFPLVVFAQDGLISVKSKHAVGTTTDRLEKMLVDKGMKVFTRINHAAGAKNAGIDLRPTELLVFGNPRVGAPLMKCSQSIAIDLPQKALIWQDESGQVWLSYNDPQYLAERHDTKGCDAVLEKVANALGNFAKMATSP